MMRDALPWIGGFLMVVTFLTSLRLAGEAAAGSTLQAIVYGAGLVALVSVFALIRRATSDSWGR